MIRGTNAGAVMLLALAAANAQGAGVRRAVVLEEAKGAGPQAYCATLDASDFANTAAGLRGMHLLADGAPAPFAITESKQERNASESARIEDLREENGQLRFTLIMPPHAYTALNFKLKLKDFVVLAEIAGGANSRQFRLFDLSHEHLGRQTVVQLPEMRDEKLQVTLRSVDKPLHGADVEGVDVLPDRIAQVIYTPVYHVQRQDSLSLSGFIKGGDETEAYFLVDAHVPVKRVHFEWDAKAKNFLRHIRIEAWPVTDANDVEEVEGAISSTHRMESGGCQFAATCSTSSHRRGGRG